jgi:beta-mannan synthase
LVEDWRWVDDIYMTTISVYGVCLQVYRLSIGAACGLWWPSEKLVIQVLDDSTDGTIRSLVEAECRRWASKGIRVHYENRSNRNGYKAGAMREGLKKDYARDC